MFRPADFAGLRAGEDQEIVDHAREAVEFLQLAHEKATIVFDGMAFEQSDFGFAAQYGEGSAQLVRDAGGELAHLADGIFQTRQGFVEGLREFVDFVSGAAQGQPLLQFVDIDLARGNRQFLHGAEGPVGHLPTHKAEAKTPSGARSRTACRKTLRASSAGARGMPTRIKKELASRAREYRVVKAKAFLIQLEIGEFSGRGECAT